MTRHPAIRHLLVLAVLLGVLASGSSVLARGTAAIAGEETVVFSSLRHGNSEIYSVRPDGSGLERLTSHAAIDAFPSMSPDGNRIAFASTRTGNSDIYVMNVDGSELKRLTTHNAIDTEPEWSPDGSRIAFTSSRTGLGDIYSMSAVDGSGLQRLTSHAATDASPAWSKDGLIAFSSLRSGLGDVYRMRSDGTQVQRLTTSIAPDLFPAWSADGERLAFSSLRSGLGDIYRMRADGTQETRLTQSSAIESEPAWSTDGTRLVHTAKAQGSGFDLRIVNADGSGGAPLAAHSALDASPDWGGKSSGPPDPVGGVLLEGDPDDLAIDAIVTYTPGEGVPNDEFSPDASGTMVARTQIEVGLTDDATVGQVNALLGSIDGRIASMLDDVAIILVRIPDPGSIAGLEAVIARVEASPIVRFVLEARAGTEAVLPSNHTDLANLDKINHNMAVRLPAAWNARSALSVSTAQKPQLIVADFFGGGAPTSDMDAVLQPGDFGSGAPKSHGYHVLGIVAADYAGTSTNRGLATGAFPDTMNTRVVDFVVDSNRTRTDAEVEDLIVALARSSSGNVVVNTSLQFPCETPEKAFANCNQIVAAREARAWIERVRGGNGEGRFLHVTAAGNVEVALDTDARTASNYAAAKLLRFAVQTPSGPVVVPNLTNTLVVENVRHFANGSRPACLSPISKAGGDLAAIGTNVWSLTDAGSAADNQNGTSMASPQVAGLAAYVWSMAPSLTPQQVMTVLLETASPGVTLADAACSPTRSKPVIDAYEAVLSLDEEGLPTPDGAPIRKAILDEDEDGRFTLADMEEFLDHFIDASGTPVAPMTADYGRYDLNGDGFTGGPRTAKFDLDREGSVQYGAPSFSGDVEQEIAGETVTFDENAVTDLEILCYYAYSGLFVPVDSGDLLRDDRLEEHCLPDNAIVFTSLRDGNWEIYVMKANGTEQTRLTNNTAVDEDQVWSPDGTRIAFTSNRDGNYEIYVMNADGFGQTRLTNSPGDDVDPVWSPDRTKIAFLSYRDGNMEIYVMNADGSGQTRLTNSAGTNTGRDENPVWSPDGTKIAFVTGRHATPLGNTDGNLEIYVMNADGSGQTRLTNNTAIDDDPVWSPDGTKIAFASNRDGNYEIYVMNADGSGQTRLTNQTHVDHEPVWSPDGRTIVFESAISVNWEIQAMSADGSGQTRLTNSPGDDVDPVWSPDGTKIAFVRQQNIFVMNADGSGQTQLSTTQTERKPDW